MRMNLKPRKPNKDINNKLIIFHQIVQEMSTSCNGIKLLLDAVKSDIVLNEHLHVY